AVYDPPDRDVLPVEERVADAQKVERAGDGDTFDFATERALYLVAFDVPVAGEKLVGERPGERPNSIRDVFGNVIVVAQRERAYLRRGDQLRDGDGPRCGAARRRHRGDQRGREVVVVSDLHVVTPAASSAGNAA